VVEIRNAMVEIVRVSGGIAVDELHREIIRTFGAKRLTAGVIVRLNEGLQYGVDTERLELRGELVHLT
jgi:ribosomal protein L30/L7E